MECLASSFLSNALTFDDAPHLCATDTSLQVSRHFFTECRTAHTDNLISLPQMPTSSNRKAQESAVATMKRLAG